MVMGNTMTGCSNIQQIFDLKGSMINRYCKPPKTGGFKPTKTIKDLNLLAMNKNRLWLNFRQKDQERIIRLMREDVKLLEKFNLMDYSLLLTITENDEWIKAKNRVTGPVNAAMREELL